MSIIKNWVLQAIRDNQFFSLADLSIIIITNQNTIDLQITTTFNERFEMLAKKFSNFSTALLKLLNITNEQITQLLRLITEKNLHGK